MSCVFVLFWQLLNTSKLKCALIEIIKTHWISNYKCIIYNEKLVYYRKFILCFDNKQLINYVFGFHCKKYIFSYTTFYVAVCLVYVFQLCFLAGC